MAFLEAEAEAADGEEDGRNPIHSWEGTVNITRSDGGCQRISEPGTIGSYTNTGTGVCARRHCARSQTVSVDC